MARKPYLSDSSDEEWEQIEDLIPPAKKGGHPRTVSMREVFNAIFYLNRSDCGWHHLPHDLPPKSTVYDYFSRFRDDGTWEKINQLLRQRDRVQEGRCSTPSAASLDTQSVKTTEKRGPAVASTREKGSKDANATY